MNIIISIFILTLVVFSIFSYSFVDIHLSYLSNLYTGLYLNQRIILSTIYLFLSLILFGCSYFLLTNINRIKINLSKIILFIIVATIFAYPAALTFDIFNYMTTARVTFLYQENPYIIYPIEFIGEPYLAFTRATNKTALYGPFWILLSGIPYFAGFGFFLITLFSFKTFIAAFYIGTIYLMKKLDKNAVLFFALNPLVIIEALVSSHNDIVMIFFALWSFYLFFRKKYAFSILSIVGSIFIKPAILFLAPVFLGFAKDKLVRSIIDQEKVFRYSAIFMFVIFTLSPLREELYPWYATWFIAFTAFLHKNKFLQNAILILSFGLMLRYIPYMATGNYFGSTPVIRNVLMITPLSFYLMYLWVRKIYR